MGARGGFHLLQLAEGGDAASVLLAKRFQVADGFINLTVVGIELLARFADENRIFKAAL